MISRTLQSFAVTLASICVGTNALAGGWPSNWDYIEIGGERYPADRSSICQNAFGYLGQVARGCGQEVTCERVLKMVDEFREKCSRVSLPQHVKGLKKIEQDVRRQMEAAPPTSPEDPARSPYDIPRTKVHQRQKVDKLAKWTRVGFTPEEAKLWQAKVSKPAPPYSITFSPDEAAAWKKAGFTPEEAALWYDTAKTDQGYSTVVPFKPGEAASWKEVGFDLKGAKRLAGVGLAPLCDFS